MDGWNDDIGNDDSVDEDNGDGDVDVDGIVDDNERSTYSRNFSSAPCRLLPLVTCHPVKLVTKNLILIKKCDHGQQNNQFSISSTTCYLPPCFSSSGDPEICNQS